MPVRRPGALPWFLVILLTTVAWQSFYCRIATEGKLTGLFFIGSVSPRLPEPDGHVFVYPGSTGYDGQVYRAIARDPWLRDGVASQLYGPRYWYRRILVPGIAALLGGGSPVAIDFFFVAVTDLLLAAGGVCFIRLAGGLCRPGFAAFLYLMIPAVVASTDRMVSDGVMAALIFMAWWFHRERRFGALWGALAALPLAREVGILLLPGVVLAYVWAGQLRRAAWMATSALPMLAWWAYLASHTPPSTVGLQAGWPVWAHVARLFTLRHRPISPLANAAAQSLDVAAMVCLLVAFAWIGTRAVREFRAGGFKDDTILVLPLAAAATFFSGPTLLSEPYDFMRHWSVLLAWVALRLLAIRPVYALGYLAASSAALLSFRLVAALRPFIRLPL